MPKGKIPFRYSNINIILHIDKEIANSSRHVDQQFNLAKIAVTIKCKHKKGRPKSTSLL
jgi:hypothetical protein